MIEMQQIIIGFIGILTSVVGFFLIRTMSKLDNTHDMAFQNKMDLALLKRESELNYSHINEKLDDIKSSIEEIKQQLKK